MARVNSRLTQNESIKNFILFSRAHCSEYGVAIRFTSGNKINSQDGEFRCYGYFSEPWRQRSKGKGYAYDNSYTEDIKKVSKLNSEKIGITTFSAEGR